MSLVRLDDLIQELKRGRNFASVFGVKNKWKRMTAADIQNTPELAQELFDLLSTAYKPIGGHLKFGDVTDLFGGKLVFQAIDLDADPEADAAKFAKKKSAGLKSVGMGHDGSKKAKQAVVKKSADDLKRKGYYAEMSGTIAHIMITKFGVKSVDDEVVVRGVLKKEIEWIGEHPQGKYPGNKGWYDRVIGGKKIRKIMLGLPLVRAKSEARLRPLDLFALQAT